MENIDGYITIILAAFSLLVAIAAITPTERDNNALDRVSNLIKLLKKLKKGSGK